MKGSNKKFAASLIIAALFSTVSVYADTLSEIQINKRLYPGANSVHTQTVNFTNLEHIDEVNLITDWWQKRPTEIRVYENHDGEKGSLVAMKEFLSYDSMVCGENFDAKCSYPNAPKAMLSVPVDSAMDSMIVEIEGLLSPANNYAILDTLVVTSPPGSGFYCDDWDGSVPSEGSYLRLKNVVAKDQSNGPSKYRTDIAGKYLANVLHGSQPTPKFSSTNTESFSTLYKVVESRNSANGPEVRLQSPAAGLGAKTTVGFSHGTMITSGHPYWSIQSEWIRLAHRYRAWTDPGCGHCAAWLDDKFEPTAVLQRVTYEGGESCSQEYTGIYQFLNCHDYYVSIGGYSGETNRHLAAQASDVNVEVCSVY